MGNRKLYEIWKEESKWKIQSLGGIETRNSKAAAEDFVTAYKKIDANILAKGGKLPKFPAMSKKAQKKKLITVDQVLEKLIALCSDKVVAGTLVSCDMLDQEELFDVQEKLMDIMESINHKKCIKAFPWMYKEVKRKII